MSRRARKREQAPMPAASAGLLRFYEEEAGGIELRPEVIVIAAVALIVVCIVANIFFR